MAKKYVPEGAFLACDKGTSPSTLRVSNNMSTTIYGVAMATEADKLPFFNIKPMGLFAMSGSACLPMVLKWDNPKEGVKINGNRMLLEDSTCKCLLSGTIKIFFDRPTAVGYGMGEGKMPGEYIKDGFDWMAKQKEKNEREREKMLPGWMEGIADVGDWFTDLNAGLVEGAINGVVGLGETIYQVAQDPVGTVEALGGMVKDGYNWVTDEDNLQKTFDSTVKWASELNKEKIAKGIKDAAVWVAENPRKIGTTTGEFIPDVVAAVYTGGGSVAASTAKKGLKELGEEAVEQVVKKGADDVVEAGVKKGIKETMEQLAKKEGGDIAAVVTKSAAEKAKDLLDDVLKKFDPAKATNKQKGNFGEIASQSNMLKNPNLKNLIEAPKGLDATIKKGIDGIYENSKPPPKFIIDEAKYGKSTLNPKTKSGPQMSDNWVKDRLEKQLGKPKAKEVLRAMKNGEVDKVLSKIDDAGNVTTYKIDAKGGIGKIWP